MGRTVGSFVVGLIVVGFLVGFWVSILTYLHHYAISLQAPTEPPIVEIPLSCPATFDCMCGNCTDDSSCGDNEVNHTSYCGGGCEWIPPNDNVTLLVPLELDFQVCGAVDGTIEVKFKKCSDEISFGDVDNGPVDGIFTVDPPEPNTQTCSQAVKMNPEIDVIVGGKTYRIHTSCSFPIYLGQCFSELGDGDRYSDFGPQVEGVPQVCIVGYRDADGNNTISSLDPCADIIPLEPTIPTETTVASVTTAAPETTVAINQLTCGNFKDACDDTNPCCGGLTCRRGKCRGQV